MYQFPVNRAVVNDCTTGPDVPLPANTRIVTSPESPSRHPPYPEITGVVSLVGVSIPTVTTGGVTSAPATTVNVRATL